MFVRSTQGQVSPDQIDTLVETARSAIEAMGNPEGFEGIAILANRETGAGSIVTYWATAEAMQASEEAATKARDSVGALQVTDVDRFEVVLRERAAPPTAPAFARVVEARGAPDKLDQLTAFVRDQVVPAVKTLPGFRAALVSVNRETGRSVSATIWTSAAEREASEAAIAPLRDQARASLGAESMTVERYEVVYADIKVRAPA